MKKQSLEEYLAEHGLLFPISDYALDKMVIPHGLTYRKRKELEKNIIRHANDHQGKRAEAVTEYNRLVSCGEIIPKTSVEKTIEMAKYGHPDNTATQAARRMCAKRGIDWETA